MIKLIEDRREAVTMTTLDGSKAFKFCETTVQVLMDVYFQVVMDTPVFSFIPLSACAKLFFFFLSLTLKK